MRITAVFILLWVVQSFVFPFTSNAQSVSYTLSTDESNSSKSYIARDLVSMQPGFTYTATAGKSFTAKIDPTLLFPHPQNFLTPDGQLTTNPSLGAIVGSIPAQFSVSPIGSATYNIPIECPAGINGMQPNLTLVYNSNGGDGICGIGWSLSGISAITCIPKTIFSNDSITGINLTKPADQYALDGNPLYVNGSALYGGDNSSYYTQNETNCQITSHGSISGQNGRIAPEYFQVLTADGKLMEYRHVVRPGSNNLTAPYQWLISKITDANGNYLDFTYTTNNRKQTVLSQVSYGGNTSGTNHFASITFNYGVKAVVKNSYIAGFPVEDALLVQSIQVKSTPAGQVEQLLKTYGLQYNYSNNKYYLSNVSFTGENGCKLNPTSFSWGANPINPTVQNCTVSSLSKPGQTVVNSRISCGDYDGDGFADIAQVYKTTETFMGQTYIRNYLTINSTGINGSSSILLDTLLGENMYLDNGFLYGDKKFEEISFKMSDAIHFAEFNGDGKKSILIPSISNFGGNIFRLHTSNSGLNISYPLQMGYEMPNYTIGDFNNDGIDEIIIVESKYSVFDGGAKILYVKKNNYSQELSIEDELISDYLFLPIGGDIKRLIATDFNCDGLLDCILISDIETKFLKNIGGTMKSDGIVHTKFQSAGFTFDLKADFSLIREGDFNGDGLIDFLKHYNNGSKWELVINTHLDFSSSDIDNMTEYIDENDENEGCFIVDFNRDGKSDVIIIDVTNANQTNIKWYASTGSGFELVHSYSVNDAYYFKNNNFSIADFNGDGFYETFNFDSNLLTGTDSSDTGRIYYLNTNQEADKIVGITDGIGNTKQLHYQYLTYPIDRMGGGTFYSKGSNISAPLSKMVLPITCVNRISNPDGTQLRYSYSGLTYHRLRGILGFTTTTLMDSLSNRKYVTSTQYNTNYGLPEYSYNDVGLISNGEIEHITENWSNVSKSSKVIKSRLSQSRQTLGNGGFEVNLEYFYDSWGNVLSTIKTGQYFSETKSIDYTPIGSWSWCPNKPVRTTVLKQTHDSQTRISAFGYDSKGNLLADTTDVGDENQVVTSYSNFNVFGNPQSISIKANGIVRNSTMAYTPSGRFVNSKTDATGNTTTYNWDEVYGRLNSETGTLGVTSYTYDNHGQLLETRFPDGIRKSEVIRWADPGNVLGAKYYSLSLTSGGSPFQTWYDAFGREIQTDSRGLNDEFYSIRTTYNDRGQVYQKSKPFFEGDPIEWASTTTYDVSQTYDFKTVVSDFGTTTYRQSPYSGVITSINGEEWSNYNALGQKEYYTSHEFYSVYYDYSAAGNLTEVYPMGPNYKWDTRPITLEYDLQGNRTKINDPEYGTVENKYNGFGEMLWNKRAIHQAGEVVTTTNTYHPSGLIQSQTRQSIGSTDTIQYTYDASNHNRLSGIKLGSTNEQSFSYGPFDRIEGVTETIGDKTFVVKNEYDALGRLKTRTYPSGYKLTHYYDNNSNLVNITDDNYRNVWALKTVNAQGQPTTVDKGTARSYYTYDARGNLISKKATSIQKLLLSYNDKGNLEYRIDSAMGQREDFTYDIHNRLTNWHVSNSSTSRQDSVTYDSFMTSEFEYGNIVRKSDLGEVSMHYGINGRPHALDSIDGVPINFPTANLSVTYTDFGKIKTLTEGNKSYELVYGVDNERRQSIYRVNGVVQMTKYYLGDYEEEVTPDGNIRKIHYISGDDGLSAILIRNHGSDTLYYCYTDQLGSLTALTDMYGNVVERFAYDPWGKRRNPENWAQSDSRPGHIVTRGYTMHEHIDAFNIINMNGRVYDPLTAQFFSPDPFVQAPDNWMNYNRYSYCLNNPLKYTDPSGEIFIIDDWVIGFVKGFARSIGGKHEDGHHTWFGDAWASANRHADNSAKIWGGLFAADTDREGWGWQIVSRLIWQLPQTILGFGAAHGENMIGQVENVDYCEGATVVTKKGERAFFDKTTAYTLGSYIIGGNNLQPNVRNSLFQHEYGHYLQSQAAGWDYIPRFAIPSALNPSRNGGYTDLSEDTEQDAHARSLLYLTKYVDGFTYDDWNYYKLPFYDRPDGTIVNRKRINESFLKDKLMIPTYIKELIIK